ncbi:hypothetical protein P9858_20180 [Niallia circulans]|nr:hypothetical protein [Niallia circulans]
MTVVLAACTEADTVSENLSKSADSFRPEQIVPDIELQTSK